MPEYENEELYNNEETDLEENATPSVNEDTGATQSSDNYGLDDLSDFFQDELEKIEKETALSEDLEGYAKGFPDWDLVPPNDK